jgi:hypothetical protein
MALSRSSALWYWTSRNPYSPAATVGGPVQFSRTGTATVVDQQGWAGDVPASTPRHEWVTVDGVRRAALLLEPARMNLVRTSEPHLGQVKLYSTNTSGIEVDHAGFGTGIRVPAGTGVEEYVYVDADPISTGYHTISAHVEMLDGGGPPALATSASGGDFALVLNNQYATLATRVEALGRSGMYRVEATVNVGTVGTDNHGLTRSTAHTQRAFDVTGWQVEAGAYSTSYIPTTGTTTPRLAELCGWTGGPLPQQDMAMHLRIIKGHAGDGGAGDAVILHMGAASDANPRGNLVFSGAGVYWYYHNGTTFAASSIVLPSERGQVVDLDLLRFADGSGRLVGSVDGGSVVGAALTTLALPAAEAGRAIYFNARGDGGFPGSNRFLDFWVVKAGDLAAPATAGGDQARADELRGFLLSPAGD